eukprot:5041793-Pyramimonas_sp.AAC.1
MFSPAASITLSGSINVCSLNIVQKRAVFADFRARNPTRAFVGRQTVHIGSIRCNRARQQRAVARKEDRRAVK